MRLSTSTGRGGRFVPVLAPVKRLGIVLGALALAASSAAAQDASRRVELHFTPTGRAQIALWIESADGTRMATVRLTESVAVRGIGNRPGATQMNSGFRWPYGRREGVLPIWAHRRIEAGGQPFSRVIFDGRTSEGNASTTGGEPRNTRDDYFCLSFNRELSGRDALDAVTCASVFNSNKGRYVTEADVNAGYSEPWEREDGTGMMRPLSRTSIYPPRRDHTACTTPGCGDSADARTYNADARRVMPEIDAVTMATPGADLPQRISWDVPPDWPEGEYVAFLEIHVEGDYNAHHDDRTHPTPDTPSGRWDYWAMQYGYAYRGQPSVLYRVPFTLTPVGGEFSTSMPAGYGALHGEDGLVHEMDGTITDDPGGAPGSGADRLRLGEQGRLKVVVPQWNVCELPDPPEECGRECTPGSEVCGRDLICGPEFTCVGLCDVPMAPMAIEGLTLLPHPNEKQSHQHARLRFEVPASPRRVARYEVRVGTEPIVDLESFERALPAVEPRIERVELRVPVEGQAGDSIEVDFGGMTPQTTYFVAVRAVDECNAPGPFAVSTVTTTEIHFTTVSPCFVATAAYGSPLEPRIGVLRRFRDRHLMTNALGRALVDAYYTIGPHAADVIRGSDTLRAATRAVLAPIVALADLFD